MSGAKSGTPYPLGNAAPGFAALNPGYGIKLE
jgi:hypothetical protein